MFLISLSFSASQYNPSGGLLHHSGRVMMKEQKKNIEELVERELSDNKHSEFLWGLYNRKPTSLKKESTYEEFDISVGGNG